MMTMAVWPAVSSQPVAIAWYALASKIATMATRLTTTTAAMTVRCPAAAMASFRGTKPAMTATEKTTMGAEPIVRKPAVAMGFAGRD